MRIGVLDSGIGGLTVLKTLIENLGAQEYVYFGDEIHMPYGEKPLTQVHEYVENIAQFLYQEENIDLLVIACNTATVASFHILQEELSIPVVGMIQPGSQLALEKSNNRHIGVLATRGTVQSEAYLQKLKELAPDCQVVQEACPDFVTLIEKPYVAQKEKEQAIFQHWTKLYQQDSKIDTVILGCTHFPIWQASFQKYLPSIHWVNPAEEVARQAKNYVPKEEKEATFTSYITTGKEAFTQHLEQMLPHLPMETTRIKSFDWKKRGYDGTKN